MKKKKSSSPCTQITRQRQKYYFTVTYLNSVTDTDIPSDNVESRSKSLQEPNIFQVSAQKSRNYLYNIRNFSEQNLSRVTTC